MNKNTRTIVTIGIFYLLIIFLMFYLVLSNAWSRWIIFWTIASPLLIGVVIYIINKSRTNNTEVKIEEENPDISMDLMQDYAESCIFDENSAIPKDMPSLHNARGYTPKQEGAEIESVYIFHYKGYLGELKDGFDNLLIATPRKKKDILHFKKYKRDKEESEINKDFEEIIDKSVIHPSQNVVTELQRPDGTVEKRVQPTLYLKRQQEEAENRRIEEDEGAGE